MAFVTRATAEGAVRLGRYPTTPLKARFKDRLHDQFQRALDHTIPNRRNPESPGFPVPFWNLDFPIPLRLIPSRDQFGSQLREELFKS